LKIKQSKAKQNKKTQPNHTQNQNDNKKPIVLNYRLGATSGASIENSKNSR
jgi:hypothetical protein